MKRYVLGNYSRMPVWPVRGEGPRVWDRNGKAYLDFAGGVAVCPLGHAHPDVTRAISQQAATLVHVSNWYGIEGQADLAELLVEEVAGIPGKVFFCNSGAEANEGLIKLARRYGVKVRGVERPKIITFTQSFHGRTTGAMYATGQEKIWGGFGATPEERGFLHLPFNDVEALRQAFAPDVVAVLTEPIQGESGVRGATPEFLREIQRLCRENAALFLMDEVQAGFGRAGEMAGWRAIVPGKEIEPDGISWAKAMGSGYPLGAFWTRDATVGGVNLPEVLGPGAHGSTYGGSPLACAAGLATVRAILDEGLCANARTIGSFIAGAADHPAVSVLRQYGLFLGFELNLSSLNLPAEAVPSIFLAARLLDEGLMTVPAGPGVLRWLPPLNIDRAFAEEALTIQARVFDEFTES